MPIFKKGKGNWVKHCSECGNNGGEEIMELETIPEVEQKESLKLIKNTKGYNWEIKLLEINPDRIEEINNLMLTKFKEDNKNGT